MLWTNFRKQIKEELIRLAKATNLDSAILEEYIKEAEHQDGLAFWDNFTCGIEAFQDLDRYAAHHPSTRRQNENVDG